MERTASNADTNFFFCHYQNLVYWINLFQSIQCSEACSLFSVKKISEKKPFMPIFFLMKYIVDMNKMGKILLKNICTYFYTYFLKWMSLINFSMLIYLQIFRKEQFFLWPFFLSVQRIVLCMQLKAHFLCLELTSLIWMQLMG